MPSFEKYFTLFHRYPVVRQLDESDCGPAALLSILKFFGGNASLWHVRNLCQTGLQGTTLFDIIAAAKKLGLSATGMKGSYEDLLTGSLPAMVHVFIEPRRDHFIVVYQVKKKSLIAVDPSKGRLRLDRSEFERIWKSRVFILFNIAGQPVRQASCSWFSWLSVYLKRETVLIGQSLFLGVIFTILGLLTAFFIQQLIDRFIPSGQTEKILLTGSFLLFLLFIKAFSGYVRQRFLIELNKRFSMNVNADFITHLFNLPKKFFDFRRKGDITARIHDIIKIQQFINRISSTTLIDLIVLMGSLTVIFYYSRKMGLITVIFLPLYAGLLLFHNRLLRTAQKNVMQSFAQVESAYIDSLSGLDTILSYSAAHSFSRTNKLIFGLFQGNLEKLGMIRNRLNLFSDISATFISVLTLIYGALAVAEGSLLLGKMMAAYSLLSYLFPAVSRSVELNVSFQGAIIAMQRLFEMIFVEKEADNGNRVFEMKNVLKLEKIKFNWATNKMLFSCIDLVIPRGKMISLWGPNGAGKSTLAQLIQRKYDPDSGRITVDNLNAANIKLRDYRNKVAVVPENIHIFHSTLADNILLGRPFTIKELNGIFFRYGLDAFFERFENGPDTLIGEEFRQLSAGEKQLVGLIRALLGSPSLIIFDEGFNALDIQNENMIFSILRAYAREHAVLIITHNIKILLKTDFIYAIKQGSIIQKGIPVDLIKKPGIFNSIYAKEWLCSFPRIGEPSQNQNDMTAEYLFGMVKKSKMTDKPAR